MNIQFAVSVVYQLLGRSWAKLVHLLRGLLGDERYVARSTRAVTTRDTGEPTGVDLVFGQLE